MTEVHGFLAFHNLVRVRSMLPAAAVHSNANSTLGQKLG